MKIYSIVRIGNAYVVRAGEKSILKIASRRRAARLVVDAAGLLAQPAPPLSPEADAEPSIADDRGVIPEPGVIPDPGLIPDPGVIPDPSEVS
jgi:hypothetical protein